MPGGIITKRVILIFSFEAVPKTEVLEQPQI
jgi:hypothetical protein